MDWSGARDVKLVHWDDVAVNMSRDNDGLDYGTVSEISRNS